MLPYEHVNNLIRTLRGLDHTLVNLGSYSLEGVRIILENDWLVVGFAKFLTLTSVSFKVQNYQTKNDKPITCNEAYGKFNDMYDNLLALGRYHKVAVLTTGKAIYELIDKKITERIRGAAYE